MDSWQENSFSHGQAHHSHLTNQQALGIPFNLVEPTCIAPSFATSVSFSVETVPSRFENGHQTIDSMAMVEDLACLIKDNLSSKHLVLSVEEMFVEFLDPEQKSSGGDILMLEPMISYHRMLLHRLADIFGLAHQSIGEGDHRRLVVERCEDSSIPDVLVSDILACNDDGKESACSQSALRLLKRDTDQPGVQKYTQMQTPQVSFEERQAAYLAARERIFSEDWGQAPSEPVISRPRSVPVVARRMIAHALGKQILAKQGSKAVQSSEPVTCKEPILTVAACPATLDSSLGVNTPDTSQKISEHSPAKAAKRMFAQALGFRLLDSSYRVSSRQMEEDKIPTSPFLQENEGPACEGRNEGVNSTSESTSKDRDMVSTNKGTSFHICNQSGQPVDSKVKRENEQGKAAQRMLAQALGFRNSSMIVERRGKVFDGGTFS